MAARKKTMKAQTEMPEAASRRDRKKLEKRTRLRDAAATLFEEIGFEATTTRLVAERADVAAGTVFLYADDKVDLLFLVFHDELEAEAERAYGKLERARTADGAKMASHLLEAFRAFAAVYGRHPRAAGPFLSALPMAKSRHAIAVNVLTTGFIVRIAAYLDARKTTGEVAPHVDTFVAALTLFAQYYFALVTWASGVVTLETAIDTTLRASIELLTLGLLPRASSKKGR